MGVLRKRTLIILCGNESCAVMGSFAVTNALRYVKLDLLPDANFNIKRKTKVRRRTFNPIFNEVFQFPGMTKSDVEQRALLLGTWHVDSFGKKEFLGQCQIDLSHYPWNYGPIGVWYNLQDIKEGPIVNFGLKATNVDQNGFRKEQTSSTSVQLHFLIKSIQNVRSSKNVYATILTLAPVLLGRPSHFGACLTLASNVVAAKDN
uniref:C2 domain-containing protein n=1 Tax=Romanomermis culicivorax TaxID=13658 RepID=A0A915ICR2_ROMCU